MNPDEIYTKIIAKGMLGGWQPLEDMGDNFTWCVQNGNLLCKSMVWSQAKGNMEEFIVGCNIEKVIFDPAFACALWGDTLTSDNHGEYYAEYIFKLQQLVISEDRVKFLEQFI